MGGHRSIHQKSWLQHRQHKTFDKSLGLSSATPRQPVHKFVIRIRSLGTSEHGSANRVSGRNYCHRVVGPAVVRKCEWIDTIDTNYTIRANVHVWQTFVDVTWCCTGCSELDTQRSAQPTITKPYSTPICLRNN